MWSSRSAIVGFVLISLGLAVAPAAAGGSQLQMYTLKGAPEKIAAATEGLELADVRQTAAGIKADAV